MADRPTRGRMDGGDTNVLFPTWRSLPYRGAATACLGDVRTMCGSLIPSLPHSSAASSPTLLSPVCFPAPRSCPYQHVRLPLSIASTNGLNSPVHHQFPFLPTCPPTSIHSLHQWTEQPYPSPVSFPCPSQHVRLSPPIASTIASTHLTALSIICFLFR